MAVAFGQETRDSRGENGRMPSWGFIRDLVRVWPYLRPHWRLSAVSFLLIGLGATAGLLTPWPLAIVVDAVGGKQETPGLLHPLFGGLDRRTILIVAVVGGLVLTAGQHAIGVLGDYVSTKLSQRMTLDLRSDLFRHVQRLSQTFHDETPHGALIYSINNAAEAAGSTTVSIPPLVQSLLTLVGMFVIALRIDWELALLSLTVVPFVYYSTGYYTSRIEPQLYTVRNIEHNSLSVVFEAMRMIRVIVAFGREHYEYLRFRDWAEQAVRARVGLTVRQTVFSMVVSVITAVGSALVLGVGAFHVLRGRLTVGELLVMMTYIAAVYAPLQTISGTLTSLQDEVISLRMAMNLLDLRPEVVEAPNAFEVDRVEGHVRYENVGFAYAGREATLTGISFDVPKGRKIGIVGPTGAGKTTLVSLLPRFYDVNEGRILIDGRDIRTFSLRSLRGQVSFVHQEPMLFSGTIGHNIRYGRIEATEDEVVAAAEAANAHAFIEALPAGYDTVLGEDGSQLSGGERQRIAIARAFLKDAPILLLDEPTASVDLHTESEILDALDRLVEGRTTFLIAHRLSTLRHVDFVLVLDRGGVLESGTPDELIARDGLYARLHGLQSGVDRSADARAAHAAPPLAPLAADFDAALGFPELWRLRAARMLLDEVRARLDERPDDWLERFEQRSDSDPDLQLARALARGSLYDDGNGRNGHR
jgi:ABC-type multidrug transport system fused ATPase/permease subunit